MTAAVTEATRDGWVKLLVRACVITKDEYAGKTIVPFKAGETIKRARKTIERGNAERLLWSDESERDSVRKQ